MKATTKLFTVEDEHGEMLDVSGDGGFSVFTSHAEAQDALDGEVSSRPDVPLSVVRFNRASEAK